MLPGARGRIEGAWDDRVRLRWALPDNRRFEPLRAHGRVSPPVANFGLAAGSSLPQNVSKVIYVGSATCGITSCSQPRAAISWQGAKRRVL